MRIKKTIAALVAILLASLSAEADVLLWQVRDSPATGTDFGGNSQTINWSYAVLRATKYTTSNEAIYHGTGSPQEITLADEADDVEHGDYILGNYIYLYNDGELYYNVEPGDFSGSDSFRAAADLSAIGDFGDGSSYYFFVELFDESNMLVGYSQADAYSALREFTETANQTIDWTSINGSWHDFSWTAVPEPSSGLLMLIGLAIAGLKRKRAKNVIG